MYPHPLELLQRFLAPAVDALVALTFTIAIVFAVAAVALTAVAIGTSLVQAWREDHEARFPGTGAGDRLPGRAGAALPPPGQPANSSWSRAAR